MMLRLSPADETILLATALFAEIDRDTVLDLVSAASLSTFPNRTLLFNKDDPADRFFLVLDGRVDLFALTETGDQTIIEVIEKGHTFAQAAMFACMRFPLNGEAAPGTRLLEIPARPFLSRLAEKRGVTAKLLASLARWQQQMLAEIHDIKSRSPAQRLGLFLLAQAQPAEGVLQVRLPLTKVELASRIGVTPESLSRVLQRLRPLGVSTRGREFLIADHEALRRFCGGD